jgi:hypothetical protein
MMLKEVEGHSVEELAAMTGMNENTIKVKLFRARQKLLKAAQRLMKGSGPLDGWELNGCHRMKLRWTRVETAREAPMPGAARPNPPGRDSRISAAPSRPTVAGSLRESRYE